MHSLNSDQTTVPSGETVILWDGPDAPPAMDGGFICTWNRHPESRELSLLDYVEQNGERLRQMFLTWSDGLGSIKVSGKSLIDHLSLGDGLSYWWMTPFVEKSPWKSPWIKDVLRLFALEEILASRKPKKLVFVGRNDRLQIVLGRLCQIEGMEFEQIFSTGADRELPRMGGLVKKLPLVLQGMATLARQVWIRREFLRQGTGLWKGGKNAATIVSYFFHLEPVSESFRSRFWGNLPDLVRDLGFPLNWVHMFYPHPDIPNAKDAAAKAEGFNARSTEHERHTFIDGFLSPGVVARTIRNWFRLFSVSLRLARPMRETAEGPLRFWPLIVGDWNASLRGSAAVMNLFWKELFDAALTAAPRQSLGLYLWENQPWEQAWIHAWRKNGHGRLVGVAHSTMRFWDLRYFGHTAGSSGRFPRPMHDIAAINGKGMMDALAGAETPFEVRECEALRFAHLQPFCESRTSRSKARDGIFRIIVLGDYLPAETARMLDLLASSVSGLPQHIAFTLKPHPNHIPDVTRYGGLKIDIDTSPLGELLPLHDAAYVSNITSASLDAFLAGLPVIVLCPFNDLNYSPLRGWKDARFVSDRAGFLGAIDDAAKAGPRGSAANDYFRFDAGLSGWRRIFKLDAPTKNPGGAAASVGTNL